MNKVLLARIKELFEQGLQAKTGWGRNDILNLYNECVTQACLERIDQVINN
jgi:hypothetical protein